MDQTTRTELVNRLAERRKEKAAAETKKQTDRAALVEALKKKRAETPPDPSKIYVTERDRLYTSVIPDEYKQYLEATDFKEKSQVNDSDKYGAYLSLADDKRYTYINSESDAGKGAAKVGSFLSGFYSGDFFSNMGRYDYINEDEKELFNYLYNTKGRDEANKYLDSIADRLQERQLYEDNKRYQDRNDFVNFLSARGQGLLSGLEGISNLARGASSLIKGEKIEIDDYHTKKKQLMDAAVSDDMSPVGAFLYNTGASMTDSFISICIGAGLGGGFSGGAAKAISLISMGSQASSATASEAKARGLEDWQILSLSAIAGGIEAATEMIPLDNLFKAVGNKEIIKGGVKSFVKGVAKQSLTEATEEAISETVNIIADGIIAAEKSNFSTLCQSYMDEGMSRSDAIGKALLNSLGQVGLSALGGAVSGVGFGVGGQTIGSLRNNAYFKNVGQKALYYENSADQLIAAGEASSDSNILTMTEQVKRAYQKDPNSKATKDKLGRLSALIEEDYNEIKQKEARSLNEKTTQSERESLTKELEEYSKTEYSKKVAEYMAQKDKASVLNSAGAKFADEAKNNTTPLPAKLKYDAKTTRAYEDGLKAYQQNGGNTTVYDLGFEQARRLGRSAEGRSLTEMVRTLDKRTQKEIFALPTDAINAAFNAGVERANYYKARQAEIDAKAAEKAKNAKEGEEAKETPDNKENAQENTNKPSEKKKGLVIDESVEKLQKEGKLTRAQKRDIKKIQALAETLDSLTIRIADLRGEGRNGKYDPNTNELVVNIYAGRESASSPFEYALSQAFSHESVHYIKEHSPADYARLEAFVEDTFFKGLTLDYLVDMRRKQYLDRLALDIVREEREGLSDEDLQELDKLDRELVDKYNDLEKKSILLQLVDKEQNGEQYKKLAEERKKATEEVTALEIKLQAKLTSLGCQHSFFRAREEVSFTYEEAKEEVIANALEDIIDKPQVLNALANEDISLVKRIWRAIKQLFEKLFNKLEKYNYTSPEARLVAEATRAEWKRLSDIYVTALTNANNSAKGEVSAPSASTAAAVQSENTGLKSDNKIKFSLMNNLPLSENVKNVLNISEHDALKNKEEGNFVSVMKETPSVILENVKDAENLEIIIRFDAFYLATRHSGVLDGHYHNYGEVMSRLPEAISSPEAILRMNNDRLNIISTLPNVKSGNATISIELNTVKDINSEYKKYNLVATVIPSKDSYIRNNILNKGISVEYEKEDLSQVNPQLHEWLAIINDKSSANSIPENKEKVNTSEKKVKNSFAGTPSETAHANMSEEVDGNGHKEYNKKRKKKQAYYSQYSSTVMQWAFSSKTKPGDIKVFYNPQDNTWNKLVAEETEYRYGTLLSIEDTPENAEKIRQLHEEVYNENYREKRELGEGICENYERYWRLSNDLGNDNLNVTDKDANGHISEIRREEPNSNRSGHSVRSRKDSGVKSSLTGYGISDERLAEAFADGRVKNSLSETSNPLENYTEEDYNVNQETNLTNGGITDGEDYQNPGLLEGREPSGRDEDRIRQLRSSSEKIYTRLVGYQLSQGNRREGGTEPSGFLASGRISILRHRTGILRDLRRRRLNGSDTTGRTISQEVYENFQDTVFKDGKGSLLSLFHWTDAEFTRFAKGDIGFHFGTIQAAHKRNIDALKNKRKNVQNTIYKECYLNLKNPVFLEFDPMTWCVFSASHLLEREGIITDIEHEGLKTLDGYRHTQYNAAAAIELRKILLEKGYDGIIYSNSHEGDLSVMAFYPDQIYTVAENGKEIAHSIDDNTTGVKSSLTGYGISDERLAEAFAELAMTDVEFSWLKRYKEKAKQIGEWQEEKEKAQAKLKQLEERKKKTEAGENLDAIYKDIKEQRSIIDSREAAINSQREKMLNIQNAGPLRELMLYKQKLVESDLRMRYGHEKVYSRKDAAVMFEDALIKNMPRKTRNAFIEEILTGLNKHTSWKARNRFAYEMGTKLVDSVWKDSEYLVKDTEGFRERFDILSPGAKRLEFTEDESKELLAKLGLKKTTSLMLEWEYNKLGEALNAREFILNSAKTLEENGTLAKVDDKNYIDTFLELNELYQNAKRFVELGQDVKKEDGTTWPEKQKIAKEFAQEILGLYQNTGTKTKYGKTVDYYKRQIEDMRDQTKLLSLLEWRAIKMRELKYGAFVNATKTFDNITLQQVISDLASVQYRGRINVKDGKRLKKALADLALWYTEDNRMINDKENKDNPQANYYVQDIADKIKYLKDLDSFFNHDLKELTAVFDHLIKLVETYNKVYVKGKWVDAKELATGYLDKIKANFEMGIKPFSTIFKYGQAFFDPRSLCRAIDGYDPDGFCTTILDMLADAAINAQLEERNLLNEYNEFMKENKNYAEDAKKDIVTIRGVSLPKANLIQLYMTTKRKQAAAGLVYNGFKLEYKEKRKYLISDFKGLATQDEQLTDGEISARLDTFRTEIEELLTEADKKYIKVLEKVYNHSAKELKRQRDIDRMGYSNVVEGYYVPIRRDGIAHSVDSANYFDELNDRVSHASFNKNTVRGAKQKLFICDADAVFRRHTRMISLYAHLHPVIEVYDRMCTVDCAKNENANAPETIKAALDKSWKDGSAYIRNIIADMQGVRASQANDAALAPLNKALGNLTSGYAISALGLNPKVWLTQISSLFSSFNLLDIGPLTKAFALERSSFSDVDKYCEYAMLRHTDNAAAKAQGLFDNVHHLLEWTMAPIGHMDRAIVVHLFGACQYQVEKDTKGKLAVGTEENKVKAGELLKRVILETQQNAIMTERSAAMRSQNTIIRFFTMFKSDAMKVVGRVIDALGEIRVLQKRIAHCNDTAERENLLRQRRVAWTKLARSTTSLVFTSAYMTALAFLWSAMRGKLSDDKKERWHDAGVDFIGNLIGGLPLITDFYTKLLEGYDSEYVALSSINDMIGSVSSLFDALAEGIWDGDWKNIGKRIKTFVFATTHIFGIPTRNVFNIIRTIVRMFVPDWVDNVADKYV